MSKKTTTISFSLPTKLAETLDETCDTLNITRSAFLTALISTVLNWIKRLN